MGHGSSSRRCTSDGPLRRDPSPRGERSARRLASRLHGVVALVALLATACSPTAAPTPAPANASAGEDWPCFLGSRHDSTSAETGILTTWAAGGLPVVW